MMHIWRTVRGRGGHRPPGWTEAAALLLLSLLPSPARAQWPYWRGPLQDGAAAETGLPASWSPEGENLAWKAPIGGRSTPVVLGDHLYLLTRGGKGPTEHERVVCLSTADGRLLWEHRMPIFLTDIPSNRVGWSSPVGDPETGNVYVHGVQGLLLALDRNGKLLWSHSLTEEFGRFSGYGGRVQTPVLDEDLLIISFLNSSWGDQGRMWHRFLALDKKTGEARWWSSPGGPPLDTNYSTGVVTVVRGTRLFITGAGDGAVQALKVRTGEPVWLFRLSKRGINASVVVEGERVFASHSEENIDTTTMGRLVAIDATGRGDVTGSKELWRIDELQAGYASPALHAGKLYVVDNSAKLECISAADGKRLWKEKLGTVGKGSPVWADGKIYATEVNGTFHILEDGPGGAKSLDQEKFESTDGTVIEVNGSPAVAGGRVYFCTRDETFALGPRETRPAVMAAVQAVQEAAPGEPGHLQLVPADAVLSPGEKVKLTARLYDQNGRFLKTVEGPSLSLKGLKGALGPGEFTPAAEIPFQAGLLEAREGELVAAARVRVVAPLPLRQDFEKLPPAPPVPTAKAGEPGAKAGQPGGKPGEPGAKAVESGPLPVGWIGISPLKFKVVERDGSHVLQKLANDARFMRADVYIGRPEWGGYTIGADVLGTYARRTLPDIGLMGCRYTLYLTKHVQELRNIVRLVAWVPMPRLQKDVPFDWKQDVWYRMKLRVDPRGDGGVVRGKVWPRSEKEPSSWTIEMEDPLPTFSGSPGFTAFTPGITDRSQGPLAFFDNIEVTTDHQ